MTQAAPASVLRSSSTFVTRQPCGVAFTPAFNTWSVSPAFLPLRPQPSLSTSNISEAALILASFWRNSSMAGPTRSAGAAWNG